MAFEADDYDEVLQELKRKSDKEKLRKLYRKKKNKKREEIKNNIHTDREHLELLNLIVSPFFHESTLHKKTGYLFIKVEPLYNTEHKDFDVAIFRKKKGNLILIECKSSISRSNASNVLKNIQGKINVVETHQSLFKEILGEKIGTKEYVLCSWAHIIPKARIKPLIKEKKLPICLWSVDRFYKNIHLEKISGDASSEIGAGRLHKDKKIRKLLLESVDVANRAVPTVRFLPSSHPSIILSEISASLKVHIRRMEMQEFGFDDVHSLVRDQKIYKGYLGKKTSALTERIVQWGIKSKIFKDETPKVSDLRDKKFSLQRYGDNEIKSEFVETIADKRAKREALKEFREKVPSIEKF